MCSISKSDHDAIVLAGGRSRRLDKTDKTSLVLGGMTLLERVGLAVEAADRLVLVGTPRALPAVGREVIWRQEDPPGGGPVAGLAAGLPATRAGVVVVLAADLPWIAPAVPVLLAALPESGVAQLVDTSGRVNHLAAVWRRAALVDALARLATPAGASMRSLIEGVETVRVTDIDGWSQDCDTWADVERARSRFS